MEKITWSDKFSVGVLELDEQHKKIIELINELDVNMNLSPRSEKLHNILGRIIIYAQKHLDFEESLLRDGNPPEK